MLDFQFKLCEKHNLTISKIELVFEILSLNGKLPPEYKSHKLSGNYKNCWECHIESDWLLTWKHKPGYKITLVRTGTHSDLF
ncbi:MAG: type II toxin-antitoxin system YafQ family toxin [Prolixibacteraceae bacterium]|nr:type II toxin-antitoxin system YafQ family toxin [Prolixibacteraceae bacterium]